MDEARARGAMMIFEEKYGGRRAHAEHGQSPPSCAGGIHARATGDIGLFKIVSEQGVSAGVRRIIAVTGDGALAYLRDVEASFAKVVSLAKATPANVHRQGREAPATRARARKADRRAATEARDRRRWRRSRRAARQSARQSPASKCWCVAHGGDGSRGPARAGRATPGQARPERGLGRLGGGRQSSTRADRGQRFDGSAQGRRADQEPSADRGRLGRR